MEILRLKLKDENKKSTKDCIHISSSILFPSDWKVGEFIEWRKLHDLKLVKSIRKYLGKDVDDPKYRLFKINTIVKSFKGSIPVYCIIAEFYYLNDLFDEIEWED